MKKDAKKINLVLIILIIMLSTCFSCMQIKAEETNKRVLFISSYTESFESVTDQVKGVIDVFYSQNIQCDIEYMDTKRIDTQENVDLFFSMLKYKLSKVEPYDALIVGDDKALEFALEYQVELFNGLPIVFLGVNDIEKGREAAGNNFITGILQETPLNENIDLALKINPDATKVIAFSDSSSTGMGDKEQFYKIEKYYPQLAFSDYDISEYTFDEMAEIVGSIGDDTIILLMNFYTDKTGKYITIDEAAKFFERHANVPVYRASFGGVGSGILGGKVISFKELGQMSANIVLDVFNGIPIESINIVEESPSHYVFDYEIIKKFDIDMSLLPENSIFVNKELTFYEQYKELCLTICFIIFTLLTFTIVLTVSNYKQKLMRKEICENHEELTATYEELTATEEELRDQYTTTQEYLKSIELLNQKYQNSICCTNSVVWEYEINNRVIYFSDNFKEVFPIELEHLNCIDDILRQTLDKKYANRLVTEVLKYKNKEKEEIYLEIPLRKIGDKIKWVLIQGRGIINDKGEASIIHGILKDITERVEQDQYIAHMAHHDFLTNLPNRGWFMSKLKEEMKTKKSLIIMIMDIDNFKEINDTLGHVYGDSILKVVAERLSSFSNDSIFISRFGGDEFLLLMTDELDTAEILIEKIQERLESTIVLDYIECNLKFSLGLTRYPEDSTNVDQLIMYADTAMYNVKHNGKNNYLFYNQEMQEELKNKVEIDGILRKAIQEDGFYLLYQPQVCVKTREIVGFEALLRLKDYKIPPNVFITIAEETELIIKIGRWVTEEVIRQISIWITEGCEGKTISLNFSTGQLRDKGYIEFLKTTLDYYNVNANYLEIEITESIFLEQTDFTLNFLEKLKDIGVKLALDDFGTGYSSINYLTYIPLDKVKLDKSLSDKFLLLDDNTVLNSIITLVQSMGFVITAEGVEELDQYHQLQKTSCNYIQGYLFSKPVYADEVVNLYYKKFLN